MVLIQDVKKVWRAQQTQSHEESCDQGGEYSKDDDYFVVKLEYICAIALTRFIMWKLSDFNNVVDRPNSIHRVIVPIKQKEIVLHLDIVGIP